MTNQPGAEVLLQLDGISMHYGKGETAITAGNAGAMRAATAALEGLKAKLDQTYQLRIVARPRVPCSRSRCSRA